MLHLLLAGYIANGVAAVTLREEVTTVAQSGGNKGLSPDLSQGDLEFQAPPDSPARLPAGRGEEREAAGHQTERSDSFGFGPKEAPDICEVKATRRRLRNTRN